jgi:hypothetical protein
MWWIKAKAKQIVIVILVLSAAGGGAFWYQNRTDGYPGTDGGTGVRVFQNEEGQIVVSNSNAINQKLPFALPRNCDEALQLMTDIHKKDKNAFDSTPERRQVFALYDTLARELCSFTIYQKSANDFIYEWYKDLDAPATTVPGASTTVAPSSSTNTSSTSSTTTTQGE